MEREIRTEQSVLRFSHSEWEKLYRDILGKEVNAPAVSFTERPTTNPMWKQGGWKKQLMLAPLILLRITHEKKLGNYNVDTRDIGIFYKNYTRGDPETLGKEIRDVLAHEMGHDLLMHGYPAGLSRVHQKVRKLVDSEKFMQTLFWGWSTFWSLIFIVLCLKAMYQIMTRKGLLIIAGTFFDQCIVLMLLTVGTVMFLFIIYVPLIEAIEVMTNKLAKKILKEHGSKFQKIFTVQKI